MPQSFTLAVLASNVDHCTVSSVSDLVGARLPAPPSDLQVELSQIISKWGDAQREQQSQDPKLARRNDTQIHLYIVSFYKSWPTVC